MQTVKQILTYKFNANLKTKELFKEKIKFMQSIDVLWMGIAKWLN